MVYCYNIFAVVRVQLDKIMESVFLLLTTSFIGIMNNRRSLLSGIKDSK